jgi:hypothetical protein
MEPKGYFRLHISPPVALILCQTQSNQAPNPISWTSFLILYSRLRLGPSSGLFPSGFPIKNVCAPSLLLHTYRVIRLPLSPWSDHLEYFLLKPANHGAIICDRKFKIVHNKELPIQITCDSVPRWTHQGHKLESVYIFESEGNILKSLLITSKSHIFQGFTKRRFMTIFEFWKF